MHQFVLCLLKQVSCECLSVENQSGIVLQRVIPHRRKPRPVDLANGPFFEHLSIRSGFLMESLIVGYVISWQSSLSIVVTRSGGCSFTDVTNLGSPIMNLCHQKLVSNYQHVNTILRYPGSKGY